MNFYSDETYGERVADFYDEWHPDYDPHSIETLAELARGGRALELGIGTGRIALPLSEKGVEIQGIDTSDSMVSRLRAKAGSDQIVVTKGSFVDVPVEGEFSLVYIVFNTFFALSSQDEQVRCFRNVAAHLSREGCFVIEAFVPDVTRFTGDQVNWASRVTTDEVHLDVGRHDRVTQQVISQHVVITDGNVRLFPVNIRYAWPAELDLMAQLAGLQLRERWSSWEREPFSSESQKHISVYQF